MQELFEEADAADEEGSKASKGKGTPSQSQSQSKGKGTPGGGADAGGGDEKGGKGKGMPNKQEQKTQVKMGVQALATSMHSGKIPNWLPAIFFSFAKRDCEDYARACYKTDKGCAGLCFTTAEEQEVIDQVRFGPFTCGGRCVSVACRVQKADHLQPTPTDSRCLRTPSSA